jgi:hypothetical protein
VMLLATNPRGVERAEPGANGSWRVATTLADVPVTCLVAHPSVEGRLYAGTRDRGVLRSDDLGVTWHAAGMAGRMVMSLAVSRAADDLVYAGCKPASVYVSTDGGGRWSELDAFRRQRRWYWFSPAEPPDWRPYVMGLAASPTDPDVVVAGIEAGALLRSVDGGRTWSGHRKAADRDCHDLAFHASDGRWVYQAGGGGPAVSRDGGATWSHPLDGMRGRYSMAVAADPVRPEVWFVSAGPMLSLTAPWRGPTAHRQGDARGVIYRSSGGAPWERLAGGLPQPLDHPPYGLATDPAAAGHVYLGLSHGVVWHSRDHGDSWHELPLRLSGVGRTLLVA